MQALRASVIALAQGSASLPRDFPLPRRLPRAVFANGGHPSQASAQLMGGSGLEERNERDERTSPNTCTHSTYRRHLSAWCMARVVCRGCAGRNASSGSFMRRRHFSFEASFSPYMGQLFILPNGVVGQLPLAREVECSSERNLAKLHAAACANNT